MPASPRPLLGCIADDFTGATDLANMLVRGGMRTIQTIGVPDSAGLLEADALVVALKSRTIAATDAVAQSRAALAWLRAQGCRQFIFQVLLHVRFDRCGQHRSQSPMPCSMSCRKRRRRWTQRQM